MNECSLLMHVIVSCICLC